MRATMVKAVHAWRHGLRNHASSSLEGTTVIRDSRPLSCPVTTRLSIAI